MKHRIWASALALLIAPVVLALGATPASAGAGTSPTTWQNVASKHCLDVNANGVISTDVCASSTTAQWTFIQRDNFGDYSLENQSTGYCLAAPAQGGSPSFSNCKANTPQSWWTVTPDDASGSSPSELRNHTSNMCLQGSTSALVSFVTTTACNGSAQQRWQQPITGFAIHNTAVPSLCVGIDAQDVAGAWNCSGNADQTWHWGPTNSTGSFELINGNGLCLDVRGSSTAASAAIVADSCAGTAAQYWSSSATAPGAYLDNALSPFVVSTVNDVVVNSAHLVENAAFGGADQGWTLPSPTFTVLNGTSSTPANSRCIGLDAYSGVAGAWTCSTHPDQVWNWSSDGLHLVNGYGKCLGVVGGSTAAGAQLDGETCDSTRLDQTWTRVAEPNPPLTHAYVLANAKSGLVASVAGGSLSSGAAVVLGTYTGATDQFWWGV